MRLQVRRHRTPNRRVCTRDDVMSAVEPLRKSEILQLFDGEGMKGRRCAMVTCGDADRAPELINHHQTVSENKNHHLIAVNGGAFLMYRFWWRWTLFLQLVWAIRMKELDLVCLYVHWPCGAAMNIHHLELSEIIRRLQWVRSWLSTALWSVSKKEPNDKWNCIQKAPEVIALVHVDRCCHPEEVPSRKPKKTYLVAGSPELQAKAIKAIILPFRRAGDK